MMVPVDDDEDDFIVQTVEDTAAADAQQQASWSLKKLGGLVFASTSGKAPAAEVEPEPEPTLPAGFSATLNAEEEEIYPAEAKIKVLVAEGNLVGRNRRQAAELHQALQQVVGAAAIYNHLLTKHGGVGTRQKNTRVADGGASGGNGDAAGEKPTTGGDVIAGTDVAATKPAKVAACDCGGAMGSCKAISSLLKDEMDKVAAGAENERRGAMLKKFKRVERRSGGLCNPDLLEQVLRSSDVASPRTSVSSPSSSSHASPLPPPHSHSDPKGLGAAAIAAATPASNLVVVDVEDDPEVTAAAAAAATPWAEDMLCRGVRKRHAAMLRTRGRALAKGLARMLKGVSQELKGVASRLPPWEEEDPQEDEPAPQEEEAALSRIQSRSNVFGSPTHGRSSSAGSTVSVDISEDGPDKLALSSELSNGSTGVSVGGPGRPPTPSNSAASAVAAVAAKAAAAVVAPVAAVASVVAPVSTTQTPAPATGSNGRGAADDIKGRRQDWKLDAQELSLIRKEEERVMKPDVLTNLLAKGAGLGCLQQADFWDVFARLEVVTRTEALLNIAIRGGRGCAARSGRMGRELCISLTSVVLEAINTVEQAQRRSQLHSSPSTAKSCPSPQQPQQLQQGGTSGGGSNPEDEAPRDRPAATWTQAGERKRPSSERLSRGSPLALAAAGVNGAGETRERAGSVQLPATRRVKGESVAGTAGVARRFYKEDPGLKDLDRREEEFRKAIYVQRRSLATRLMRLTHDAPLCSRVLGTFVDDRANNATPTAETQNQTPARPRSFERVAAAAMSSAKSLSSRLASSPGGFSSENGKVVWNPPTSGDKHVANDAEREAGSRRPSAAGMESAPVDLLTGDTSTAAAVTTATAAATTGGKSKSGSNSLSTSSSSRSAGPESHPSPSVSVSSSTTEPLSDSSDTAHAPMAMSSSSSSSWEQEQQQQQKQVRDKRSAPVVVDKSTVAEIYKVSEDTIEVESLLV